MRSLAATAIRTVLEWAVMIPLTLLWAVFHFPALALLWLMDAAEDGLDRIERRVGGEDFDGDRDA